MFSMSLPFTVNEGLEEKVTAEVVISQLILTCTGVHFLFLKNHNIQPEWDRQVDTII